MDLLREKARARGHHRCHLGGDSESSSDQISNQIDRRVSGGAGGAQVSGDSNTVNVTASDYGAVAAGTELARNALAVGAASIGAAMTANEKSFGQLSGGLQQAYETGRAGDQRMLSMVGMAAVAIVAALAIFGKR